MQESIALHRLMGDERGTAEALLAAGFVARLQEEYQTATTLLDEGLTLARATGHAFITAACLHHLGMIAGDVHHDNAAARRLLEESLRCIARSTSHGLSPWSGSAWAQSPSPKPTLTAHTTCSGRASPG